jgi:DNA invertase Pin-like site-specific DNA recombinase
VLIHAYLHRTESGKNHADLRDAFETFALRKGQRISAYYHDQEIPAARSSLVRLLRDKGVAIAPRGWPESRTPHEPGDELFRLLGQARPNDVLLIESAGILGNLSSNQWQDFRRKIKQRKIRIVALDVESSWFMVSSESAMAPTAEKLTNMMLDMLEALALKERRGKRNRHLEGIARAKAQGKYRGRPVDQKKHERILGLLQDGHSWSEICAETGASRSTVARVVKSGN